MSRVYWVVAFAVALVVFGVVTDVFGMMYTLSTLCRDGFRPGPLFASS